LPEVSAVCDRIVVINKGKLVADGNPEELSKTLSADHRLTVRIEGNERNIYSILTSIPKVVAVRCLGEKEEGAFDFTIEAEEGSDIRRELFKRLSERGMILLYSKSMEMSLEDIFLNLTKEASAE
jgi:ABC-2 type transport system ATP-binding protein